jgi:prostaglandin-H2 D-isomerase / glutathione transferase
LHSHWLLDFAQVDGTVVAQSYAILGYAGRLAGLMPTEPLKAAQVESVLYHLMDLDVLLAPSGKEQDAAKKKQLRQDLAAGPLTSWFGHLERILANSSGYIACGELTVADLACFCRMQSFKGAHRLRLKGFPHSQSDAPSMTGAKYDDIPADIVSKYPNVSAHYDRILAHPKVAEWYTTHAL